MQPIGGPVGADVEPTFRRYTRPIRVDTSRLSKLELPGASRT